MEKSSTETPRTYIVIPGSVTGDLWHLAAAQILSSEYDKSFPPLVTVVAVTASKDGDVPDEKKCRTEVQRARVTFNYLWSIGLKVILLRLCGINAGDNSLIEQVLHSQPSAWFDQAYDAQTGKHKDLKEDKLLERPDFDQLMDMSVINVDVDLTNEQTDSSFPKLKPFTIMPANNRVLQLKTATTIAMNLLYDESKRQERRDFLAKRMFLSPTELGPADSDQPAEYKHLAEEKFEVLSSLVTDMKASGKCKGVILENYRKGHVNGGTDTSSPLSEKLTDLAKQNNLGVIGIPATATARGYAQFQNDFKSRDKKVTGIFDLYNKTATVEGVAGWNEAPWPGLDARAQAYFWYKVARANLIKGIVGGRSGSLDLAAFCGVRVLFWDEPWIEYACSPRSSKFADWIDRTANNDDVAISQIPQCLRSQQLMLLMGTTVPLRIKNMFWGSFNEDVAWNMDVEQRDDITKCLNLAPAAERLEAWDLMKGGSTPVSFNDMRKDLERPDLDIYANVIDYWLKLSQHT